MLGFKIIIVDDVIPFSVVIFLVLWLVLIITMMMTFFRRLLQYLTKSSCNSSPPLLFFSELYAVSGQTPCNLLLHTALYTLDVQ